MKLQYEIIQGKHSFGSKTFADTKAFVLRCCLPALRPRVVAAKRISTLSKAVDSWATIVVSSKSGSAVRGI